MAGDGDHTACCLWLVYGYGMSFWTYRPGPVSGPLPSQACLPLCLLGRSDSTVVKSLPVNAGDTGNTGSIPGSGRSPKVAQPTPVFLPGKFHGVHQAPPVHGGSWTQMSDWVHTSSWEHFESRSLWPKVTATSRGNIYKYSLRTGKLQLSLLFCHPWFLPFHLKQNKTKKKLPSQVRKIE